MKGILLSLALMGAALAQDAVVTVHLVEMDQEKLTAVLGGGREGMFERVRGLVKKGEAEIFDTMLVRGKVGAKMTLESNREVIFPTEYLPPMLACVPRLLNILPPTVPRMPLTPTAFETRSVGQSFECVLEAAGEGGWELNYSAEWAQYPKDVEFVALINHLGDWDRQRMPMFEARNLSQKVVLKSGTWVMGGIISNRNDDGSLDTERLMLAMVKCEIIGDEN